MGGNGFTEWTKVWDGSVKNIFLEQKYSEQDDIDHIRSLMPAFKDTSYIKVDDKAVLAFYKSSNIPNIKATIKRWLNQTEKEGIQLYICRMETFGDYGESFLQDGFDAAINFEPHGINFSEITIYRTQIIN